MIHDYALTTLDELKDFIGIVDNSQDTLLTNIINRSTDIIEKYCDRRFKETTYTEEEHDGTGSRYINLKNYPITSLTAYERNTGNVGDTDWDSLQSEFIKELENEGQIYYKFGFHKGVKNYRFSYVAGYSTIPSDLEEACLELCSYIYTDRKNKGMQSESLAEYSYSKVARTGNVIEDLGLDLILDAYRTPVIS